MTGVLFTEQHITERLFDTFALSHMNPWSNDMNEKHVVLQKRRWLVET